MALIKCSECGKEFSDKAAACPNCGCPTAETVKGAVSSEDQKEASKQILAAVERTLDRARKASARFELDADRTKQLAKAYEIDLYSNTAKSDIKFIVNNAMRGCDKLYNVLQGLVPKLDAECRQLLQKNPGAVAVRFVLGTIQWLNEESEIENNYAIKFNGFDLGNAVRAKYIPSESNRTIQAIWQAEYLKAPDQQADIEWSQKLAEHKRLTVELERKAKRTGEAPDIAERRAEEKQAAEERKKTEESKIKAEKERWEAEDERESAEIRKRYPQFEAEKQKYEANLKKWETECGDIKAKRSKRVEEMKADRIAAKKISLVAAAERKRDNAISAANDSITSQTKRKQEAEDKLATLGAFKFSEKKHMKWIIEDATRLIAEAEAAIPAAQAVYSQEISEVDKKAREIDYDFQGAVEKELPLPAKPRKPESVIRVEERQKKIEEKRKREQFDRKLESFFSKTQSTAADECEEIIDLLMDGKERTITDMVTELSIDGMDNLKISYRIRTMEREGLVVKETIERRSYYRIAL